MIALDTNVLVRFLVEDDPAQGEKARKLLRQVHARRESCFVSQIVLCELVWVLSAAYRFPRSTISEVLRDLIHTRELTFQSRDSIARAIDAYGAGPGDFGDYLIREDARAAACEKVITFDRKLLKEPGFASP